MRYNYCGHELPSVTEIIPKADIWVTPERHEELRKEGIERHRKMFMVFSLIKGENITLTDEWSIRFYELMLSLMEKYGEWLYCEMPLISKKYLFAGTPDIVLERAIPDLKSSYDKKRNALQLAGYKILVLEKHPELSKSDISEIVIDKNMKIHEPKMENAESVFLDCLDVYCKQKNIDYYFLAEKYKI